MKVWELMARLSKVPAGDDVNMAFNDTLAMGIDETARGDGCFLITCLDAMIVNPMSGEDVGLVSEIAAREESE